MGWPDKGPGKGSVALCICASIVYTAFVIGFLVDCAVHGWRKCPEEPTDLCHLSFDHRDGRQTLSYAGQIATQLKTNDTTEIEILGVIVRHLTAPPSLYFHYNISQEIKHFINLVQEKYCQ